MTVPDDAKAVRRQGLLLGAGACLIWGLLPLYFVLLRGVDAGEIVASRILFSLVLLLVATLCFRRTGKLLAVFRSPRLMAALLASALLIAVNWLVYIWAVLNGHVLAGSLGYFLNPLLNVLLGTLVLRERLGRVQGAAIALAAVGVAILAVEAAEGLWISLALAVSFALYGLIRKLAPVEALEGLTVETLLLTPVSLVYLVWLSGEGTLALGGDLRVTLLLVLSGALTAAPLLLFAASARRLPLILLGLLQYVAPSLQFILAIAVFAEPLALPQLLCFLFIWAGLILFVGHGWITGARRRRVAINPV